MRIDSKKLMGISIRKQTKRDILEKIKKYTFPDDVFLHIVSLNPEIFVLARKNKKFENIVETAQIKIVDGIGVLMAAKLMGIQPGERITGVDLMSDLIKLADTRSSRVLLIGGKAKIAERLAECYNQKFSKANFFGLEGIKNIKKPKKDEEDRIFSIVGEIRPHFVFIAFGSPYQEIWLYQHKSRFLGSICMGVGGAFDFLDGSVMRAPLLIRKIGLEWLFRLIIQPWRVKRQLRLFKFIQLLIKDRIAWIRK